MFSILLVHRSYISPKLHIFHILKSQSGSSFALASSRTAAACGAITQRRDSAPPWEVPVSPAALAGKDNSQMTQSHTSDYSLVTSWARCKHTRWSDGRGGRERERERERGRSESSFYINQQVCDQPRPILTGKPNETWSHYISTKRGIHRWCLAQGLGRGCRLKAGPS